MGIDILMVIKVKNKAIHVTLALPFWMESEKILWNQADIESSWLKKAKTSKGPFAEELLFQLLSKVKDSCPPYAALSALGCQLPIGSDDCLRIDPVEFLVDAGNVCLLGRDHLRLKLSEVQSLISSLNKFLEEEGLYIQPGGPHEWYLCLKEPPSITTHPLSKVIAHDIKAFLPTGLAQKSWHKLLTELQMLLFTHPVNVERQMSNQPKVDGVWVWGEGRLYTPYPLHDYTAIWSNESLVRGLISWANVSQALYPSEQFSIPALNAPGNYLITLNHYDLGMNSINQTIRLLFKSLEDRTIHQLSLYMGNGLAYRWSVKKRWFSFYRSSLQGRGVIIE